ncbi:MAG: hypothetical protein R3F20_08505 [Planctomycetota bacterium]
MSSSPSSSGAERPRLDAVVFADLLSLAMRRYAHRLNNVLTRLGGQLALAERDGGDPERFARRLEKLRADSAELTDVVRQLHLAARSDEEGTERMILAAFERELKCLVEAPAPGSARVAVRIAEGGAELPVRPGTLRLALLGLSEAWRASADAGSTVHLEVSRESGGARFVWSGLADRGVLVENPRHLCGRALGDAAGWSFEIEEAPEGIREVLFVPEAAL